MGTTGANCAMSLEFILLEAGYCTHPEHIVIRGGRRDACQFPATFALIRHPELGCMLFDTGYTDRFREETRHFPEKIYAWLTPVFLKEPETAIAQLAQRGITPSEIRYIFISHFHADHIAGLLDFPEARLLYLQDGYEAIRDKQGFSALRHGVLNGLLPADIADRSRPLDDFEKVDLSSLFSPFTEGYALTRDQRLIAVPLPGHMKGQTGLLVRLDANLTKTDNTFFLVADACWLSESYQQLKLPHPITKLLFADARAYEDTLKKLHALHQRQPKLVIIPAHCRATYQRLGGKPYAIAD
jgi:glyoxylase-like metal-dependent hydrolase (beta-lactamase superfamily II)